MGKFSRKVSTKSRVLVQDIDGHKREMRNPVTAVRKLLIQVTDDLTAEIPTEIRSVVASVTVKYKLRNKAFVAVREDESCN
jgi:hypothetical protein